MIKNYFIKNVINMSEKVDDQTMIYNLMLLQNVQILFSRHTYFYCIRY